MMPNVRRKKAAVAMRMSEKHTGPHFAQAVTKRCCTLLPHTCYADKQPALRRHHILSSRLRQDRPATATVAVMLRCCWMTWARDVGSAQQHCHLLGWELGNVREAASKATDAEMVTERNGC